MGVHVYATMLAKFEQAEALKLAKRMLDERTRPSFADEIAPSDRKLFRALEELDHPEFWKTKAPLTLGTIWPLEDIYEPGDISRLVRARVKVQVLCGATRVWALVRGGDETFENNPCFVWPLNEVSGAATSSNRVQRIRYRREDVMQLKRLKPEAFFDLLRENYLS